MVKYLLIAFMFCLVGCATPKFDPITIPQANFEKSKSFVISEKINKPSRPDFILLDANFKPTDDTSNASYFAFTPDNFAKIVALSTAFDGQDKMIDAMSSVINLRIDEINALKELVATKEILSQHIAVLYANEQQIRYLEQNNLTVERLMNRIFMVIQSGVIIALAVAL